LIGKEEIGYMKRTAILINTSRGQIVDEKALEDALIKNAISGAGLDVFEKEPVDKNNPLLKMRNVIVTPHTAALTMECVVKMAVSAAERVIDVLNGKKPPGIANPEVLSRRKWSHLI
ncbi:MAG: hydroxyacid dehydrogenase, partial [Spirochaetes bacterium]|nr:hydroxyacid dehydrogenase [Spirochaetota bacterium]